MPSVDLGCETEAAGWVRLFVFVRGHFACELGAYFRRARAKTRERKKKKCVCVRAWAPRARGTGGCRHSALLRRGERGGGRGGVEGVGRGSSAGTARRPPAVAGAGAAAPCRPPSSRPSMPTSCRICARAPRARSTRSRWSPARTPRRRARWRARSRRTCSAASLRSSSPRCTCSTRSRRTSGARMCPSSRLRWRPSSKRRACARRVTIRGARSRVRRALTPQRAASGPADCPRPRPRRWPPRAFVRAVTRALYSTCVAPPAQP